GLPAGLRAVEETGVLNDKVRRRAVGRIFGVCAKRWNLRSIRPPSLQLHAMLWSARGGRRRMKTLTAAFMLLLIGCVTSSGMKDEVLKRAMFDLDCPADKVSIIEIESP